MPHFVVCDLCHTAMFAYVSQKGCQAYMGTGLENSTCSLIFTNATGTRASDNFDNFSENPFFPHVCQ